MAFQLKIEPQALDEVNEAFEYYSKISVIIGEKFNKALNNALDTLEINPFFQIKYKTIRSLPLTAFPYIILYAIKENTILIYSVFHTAQNPGKYPNV